MTTQTIPIGYRLKALAERTGLSIRFWRREIKLGRISYVRFDNMIFILPDDLQKYLQERRRVRGGESETTTTNQ